MGCSEKIRYIKKECPTLVTFARDKNTTIYTEKLKLSLSRYDIDNFLIQEKDIKMLSKWFQQLKFRVKDDDKVLELYEKEIAETNSL